MVYDAVLKDPDAFDFSISSLSPLKYTSPIINTGFVDDDDRISFSSQVENILNLIKKSKNYPSFEKAGPRKNLFHDPSCTKAGIITCGGLCPGLNNVIKGLVNSLEFDYGIKQVLGIRYGYQGLTKESLHKPIELNQKLVEKIHKKGGTILGSSRGSQDPCEMVDQLISMGINILFCIGGDGTLKGASAIAKEIKKRNLGIGIVGIPKTIDNDLGFLEKTFGYETAVEVSSQIISSAKNEAEGADNGVGIVRLMGRDSGFIAASSSLANSIVDFCLVPEVDISLHGKYGLIQLLLERLNEKQNAVIVVAEGAGQKLFNDHPSKTDQSGNILKEDIGVFLKNQITQEFKKMNQTINIRYLDPSYHIRSVEANASDAIFCHQLAAHAVHAAMSGKTDLLIGFWNNFFTHVPISLATSQRRTIDLNGVLWKGVLSATFQSTTSIK